MPEGVIMRAVRAEARKAAGEVLEQVGLKMGKRGRPQSLAVLVRDELRKMGVHLMPRRRAVGGSGGDGD